MNSKLQKVNKQSNNPHIVSQNLNLKQFLDVDRYYKNKPAIYNKFYQTNLIELLDRLPKKLNQYEQSNYQQIQQKFFKKLNKQKSTKFKIQKNIQQQEKKQEQSMLQNVILSTNHQTDRLNQDIQINNYILSTLLGRGAYSVVRICKQKGNNTIQYAVKILCFDKIRRKYFIKTKQLIHMVNNQIVLLKKLKHKNIIVYKEAIYLKQKQKQRMFIIMEYCPKGSMTKLINSNLLIQDEQWWAMLKPYIKQFIEGINYLHENQIIHRDIKPQNLLLTEDDNLKIIDFNISQTLPQNCKVKITNKFIGTKGYAAPQLILDLEKQKQVDGKKIDIWAIGITILQLLERKHPYPVKTLQELIKVHQNFKKWQIEGKINANDQNQNKQYRIQINPRYPIQLQDLLKKILRFKNQDRISTQQILKHKWFKQR